MLRMKSKWNVPLKLLWGKILTTKMVLTDIDQVVNEL